MPEPFYESHWEDRVVDLLAEIRNALREQPCTSKNQPDVQQWPRPRVATCEMRLADFNPVLVWNNPDRRWYFSCVIPAGCIWTEIPPGPDAALIAESKSFQKWSDWEEKMNSEHDAETLRLKGEAALKDQPKDFIDEIMSEKRAKTEPEVWSKDDVEAYKQDLLRMGFEPAVAEKMAQEKAQMQAQTNPK